MRIDHRIRRAINTHAHQAGVAHGLAMKESLLESAKKLSKAKTPPSEIARLLGLSMAQVTLHRIK